MVGLRAKTKAHQPESKILKAFIEAVHIAVWPQLVGKRKNANRICVFPRSDFRIPAEHLELLSEQTAEGITERQVPGV